LVLLEERALATIRFGSHHLICVVLLTACSAACSSSDFAGTARKASEPAISTKAKPAEGGTGTAPGSGPSDVNQGGTDVTPGTDGATPAATPNPTITIANGETAAITHTCKDGVPQTYELKGAGDHVTVEGELCPRAFGKLSVLFVVDFSGSMKDSDPRSALQLFSCGRAAAATRILDQLKKDMRSGDDVEVGFVSFGDDAKVESALRPIKSFSANTFNFCGAANGATNYKRAFEVAQGEIASAGGDKVVYFISDGLPTLGGNGPGDENDASGVHKAAGLQAAQALIAAVPGVTLNAVFLGDGSGANASAQAYLGQITGDAARVKVAADASKLADSIVALSVPKIELNASGVTAELRSAGYPNAPVSLASFVADPAKPGAWRFKTAPFSVYEASGTSVDNLLVIGATDQHGTLHEESLTIRKTTP
jgi:uncharacterized protein YegL